jgi:hypothetical protein
MAGDGRRQAYGLAPPTSGVNRMRGRERDVAFVCILNIVLDVFFLLLIGH